MANIKISELNPLVTVQDADVLPIVDNAVTKKVTAAILRSYTQGNSVLLTGAQTIDGIKTFTSQLASTVATGTAPFSVASTTKVTNLNADLLDGLSSAAFQGALTLTTTGASGASTLNTNTLNVPNYTLAGLGGVPYTGATNDLNLDSHDLYTAKVWLKDVPNDAFGSMELTDGVLHFEDVDGHSMVTMEDGYLTIANASTIRALLDVSALSVNRDFAFPNASGTLALTSDLTAYVPTTRTVSTTSPLTGGGALSSNLTLSIPQASGSVNGYLSSANFATFNAKQNAITLTTTGTSGAATLVGSTLNIPNYADTDTGITSLNGLTALTQTFAVGTSGTDFGISSATSTHTFNLPTASAANRGALSSADWTTFNNKQNALTNPITGTGTTNYLPKFTGASALGDSIISELSGVISINGKLAINASSAFTKLDVKGVDSTAIAYFFNNTNTAGQVPGVVIEAGTNASDYSLDVKSSAGVSYFKVRGDGAATFSSSVTTTNGYISATYNAGDVITWGGIAPYANLYGALSWDVDKAIVKGRGGYALGLYVDDNVSKGITIATTGAATFSSSVTTGADATINGVTVGKGGSNIATNTALGSDALISNTSGYQNVSVGYQSQYLNSTGYQNTTLGVYAAYGLTTGNANVGIGRASLNSVQTGSNNTAIGTGSLQNNTTSNNTAVGFEAGFSNTSGTLITAIGYQAAKANTTGTDNTALGNQALFSNTTGSYNTAVGVYALGNNTTGSFNVAIGQNQQSGNYSQTTMIGVTDTATGSNQMRFGASGVVNGAVATEVNASSKVWNVFINGVAQKILLA